MQATRKKFKNRLSLVLAGISLVLLLSFCKSAGSTDAAGEDPDVLLTDLSLSSGTLSPAFSAGVTSYTASVANSVSSVVVTAKVADSDLMVTVDGTKVPPRRGGRNDRPRRGRGQGRNRRGLLRRHDEDLHRRGHAGPPRGDAERAHPVDRDALPGLQRGRHELLDLGRELGCQYQLHSRGRVFGPHDKSQQRCGFFGHRIAGDHARRRKQQHIRDRFRRNPQRPRTRSR